MKREKHLGMYLALLCATVFFLAGAERAVSPARGGTLPLRGGTLPLKIPADGALPLAMVGLAESEGAAKIAMTVDIELASAMAGAAELESMTTAFDLNLRPRSACLDLLGPMWHEELGSGRMLIGSEEFEIASVCSRELSGEVAMIIQQLSDDGDAATCFVTELQMSDDLAVVAGTINCSTAVLGVTHLQFVLGNE